MSKWILFDFDCLEHGLFEDMVKPHTHEASCPRCGRTSARQVSPVRIDRTAMATQSGATPTSIDHFERLHKGRRAIEDRHYDRNGDYGPMAGSDGGSGYPVAHTRDPVE